MRYSGVVSGKKKEHKTNSNNLTKWFWGLFAKWLHNWQKGHIIASNRPIYDSQNEILWSHNRQEIRGS